MEYGPDSVSKAAVAAEGLRTAGDAVASGSGVIDGQTNTHSMEGIAVLSSTQGIVVAIGGIAVLGVITFLATRNQSADSSGRPDRSDRTESPNGTRVEDGRRPIGPELVDSLRPIAPDHVEQANRYVSDQPVMGEDRARVEQALTEGVELALTDGSFDPAVTGPGGTSYDIVNLPATYRETAVPSNETAIHVDDLEATVRESLDRDTPIRETIRTATAVYEHCQTIEAYVTSREEQILEKREAIEAQLDDVRSLVRRLDGPVGERAQELVLDGRREGRGPGVRDLERRVEAAMDSAQRCEFEEAEHTLSTALDDCETLLVTADFVGALTGTVAHGDGTATVDIPDSVDQDLLSELERSIEKQYDVTLFRQGDSYAVSGHGSADEDGTADRSRGRTSETEQRKSGRRGRHRPEAVVDEVLYVFRELEGNAGSTERSVEYQTESLPDELATAEVLSEVVAFCERQGDLVEESSLQSDAPPGFLTLTATADRTAESVLGQLYERFEAKHG